MQEVNIRHLIRHAERLEPILGSGKIDFLALAFQHINDRILGLMNRGYSGKDVRKLAALLRKHCVRVHFHAILGFPSETPEELAEDLNFIAEQRFATGSCFLYQRRNYAPAALLPEQPEEERKREILDQARSFLTTHGYTVCDHYPNEERPDTEGTLPDILRLEQAENPLPDLFAGGAENFTVGKALPDYGPYGIVRRFSRIVLEQTAHCPNKCVFCKFRRRSRKGDMSVSDLEHVLRSFPPYAGRVELSGNGEPLTLDDLPERARLIKDYWPQAALNVLTSCNVTRDKNYFTRLLRAGVSDIRISCYGHTPEDYRALHGRDAFSELLANIDRLAACAMRFGARIHVDTFASSESIFNIKESERKYREFAGYLRARGITDIIRKPVYSGQEALRLRNVPAHVRPFPCSVVWGHRADEIMVGWDLEVWPCCFMPEREHSLGNLRESSLQEIYSSPRYREFYFRHWNRDVASLPVCRECSQPNHSPSHDELVRLAAWEGNRLAGQNVYFWGCGEAYRRYKIFFAQARPQCILYDAPATGPLKWMVYP
jgi:radical SAM protein with 4Fe4S-binding SPASM domain